MKPYYEDGSCTIYHGDCREVLPGLTADLVFADPPYGVGMEYGTEYVDEAGHDYIDWVLGVLGQCREVAPLVLWTPGMKHFGYYPPATWVLAWNKPGAVRRSVGGGFNIWEPVLVYGKRKWLHDAVTVHATDNQNHGARDSGGHPCPKPLRLLRWLIERGSDPGATVIDPYLGSGTTLRAAKDLNRRAIGIEIEERYCEIAAKRLAQEVLPLG